MHKELNSRFQTMQRHKLQDFNMVPSLSHKYM